MRLPRLLPLLRVTPVLFAVIPARDFSAARAAVAAALLLGRSRLLCFRRRATFCSRRVLFRISTVSNAHPPPLVMAWIALWWKVVGYAPP